MTPDRRSHRTEDTASQGDVAIIGMACLFPGAPNLAAFWQNIVCKVDAITDPPPSGWGVDVLYDPKSDANDRVYCKRGGFLGPLAAFDPLEHGVMPLAVQGGEPDQWLALQVARSALADAGYDGDIPERHRTAVILGKGTYLNRGNLSVVQHGGLVDQILEILSTLHPEYKETDLGLIKKELTQRLPPFGPDTVPSLIPNIAAGRIANRLDLMGPSYTVDGACASSLLALDIAVRDLLSGRYDVALVGGIHVVTPLPLALVFCQLGALSRQEQIRPFDQDADGTILGEGVGMVVLKRLEDAERDGHRIYAVVKGIGTSSDGRGLSVTAPRQEGEVMALLRAYEQAGISPRTIGLIEAHGTGTPVGDAAEIEALCRVFGSRESTLPRCALGTVKSMIGHLLPAAGIAGLIKAALALYHKVLPPTLNVTSPHPRLEGEAVPFYINTETRPWIHGADDIPRRAGINAFGFGGINAHVILEEYAAGHGVVHHSHLLHWDAEVCILSARSRPELCQRIERLDRLLQARPDVCLKDVAYTLNVPLDEGPCRLAIVAFSIEDLGQKLNRARERLADLERHQIKDVQGIYFSDRPLAASGQLAFVFPGEGSQYANMLADLCTNLPEVRGHFDHIDRIYARQGIDPLPSDFVFPRPAFSMAERDAAQAKLWQMHGAVGAVLTASHALFDLLGCLQVRPDALVGHSTGEYTAMMAGGMLDMADETRLGQFASELHRIYEQAAGEGAISRAALVAVGAGAEALSTALGELEGDAYVAMDNCPHQTVIVCPEDIVGNIVEHLQHRGLICERLPFDRPYHTPLFEAYASRLQPFVARWLVAPASIKTYSCTTASAFPIEVAQARKVAAEHWLRPVAFRETVEAMYADGVRVFVEVGPRGNLCAFIDDILRGRPHLAAPADIPTRSSTAQLGHLVGLLAVHGVQMALDDLYARRSPVKLDLDRPDATASTGERPSSRIALETGWPHMELSLETAARLRERTQEALCAAVPPVHDVQVADRKHATVPGLSGSGAAMHSTEDDETAAGRPSAVGRQPGPSEQAAQAMAAHLETMEQFLVVQQEIMQTYLSGQATARSTSDDSCVSPDVRQALPAASVDGEQPLAVLPVTEMARAAVSQQSESDGQESTAEPESLAASLGDDKAIRDLVLRLVSERTGYPIEMLNLDLDLEAELGIDSIKRVEILGAFRQQSELLQGEDVEALNGARTLQEVIDLVVTAVHTRSGDPALHSLVGAALQAGALEAPLIREIVSLKPGKELIAQCWLDLDEHLFLRDHSLGRDVSLDDPCLTGLPVMPLTMSMELMAEAAVLLVPGRTLVGMRGVRAHRWIALDADSSRLRVIARSTAAASGDEIYVQILESTETDDLSAPGPAIIEGTMVLAEDYPEPPAAGTFSLRGERPSRWKPERLYRDLMFHGSAFRGVSSMDLWGEDGAEATLEVLPPRGLLKSDPAPSFAIDPVLLDQPGQVVGFWMDEHLDVSYVVFPFGLDELHLHGPPLSPGEQVTCRARIERVSDWEVCSNLDIVRADGRVWARLVGWQDWRFDLPRDFIHFLLTPQNEVLSEPWTTPVTMLPTPERFLAYRLRLDAFPEELFVSYGAVWQRALAHTVLGRRERELWHSLRTPMARRLEWLLGRVVAKDAVRTYLRRQYDVVLPPADVEILPDEHGRPVAEGAWRKDLPHCPVVSLSHAGRIAVAVVGAGDGIAGVGVDVEPTVRLDRGAIDLAFTPDEQALLLPLTDAGRDSWSLRLWCAKEAIAKAVGQGLLGGPHAVIVKAVDASTGVVHACLTGELARQLPDAEGRSIVAYTAHEGDLIVASAVHTSSDLKEAEHEHKS